MIPCEQILPRIAERESHHRRTTSAIPAIQPSPKPWRLLRPSSAPAGRRPDLLRERWVTQGLRRKPGQARNPQVKRVRLVTGTTSGIRRAHYLPDTEGLPRTEAFIVAAPTGIADKQRPSFEKTWTEHTGGRPVFPPLRELPQPVRSARSTDPSGRSRGISQSVPRRLLGGMLRRSMSSKVFRRNRDAAYRVSVSDGRSHAQEVQVDPVSVALLAALAGGAAGEVGRQAWAGLSTLVRRPFQRDQATSPGTLEVSSGAAELVRLEEAPVDPVRAQALSTALAVRAAADADFFSDLQRWHEQAKLLPTGDGDAHNMISGGTFNGPAVQGRDFSGLSFTTNQPPPAPGAPATGS